jgi:GntR family transcriptional regulator
VDVLSPVSRDSQVPLYHQVANDLRDKIAAGIWAPGDRIPPEPQLIQRYGASRVTVRQAIALLTNEGLLTRFAGRGTFVRGVQIIAGPPRLTSFTGEMRAMGIEPSSRVISFTTVGADEHTAAKLGIPVGTDLFQLVRLRHGGNLPLGVQVAVVPAANFPELATVDFSRASLYEELEHRYGIIIDAADETFSATILDLESAEQLGVTSPSAGFLVERTGWSHGRAIEYTKSVMRGDRYRVQIQLRRGQNMVETSRQVVTSTD